MDVGTGLALLGSAKLVEKLLGPTAGYIGEGIRTWTQKRVQNVNRIFGIAIKRTGSKIDQDGKVPPKILKGILDDGSFCDDSLAAEYFGGILASSRSGVSRDDREASFIALISTLSTYQIRSHYVFYHLIKKLFDGAGLRITLPDGRQGAQTYVPLDAYVTAMAIEGEERDKFSSILSHVMFGLGKEGLIEDTFEFGSAEQLKKRFKEAASPGIIFEPSVLGVELFLWGYGRSDLEANEFLNPANAFDIIGEVTIPAGSMKTRGK